MTNIRAAKNDFINRSFRDVADKDYIAARLSHRYGLDLQFLWFSQQSLEKYLKAILLYNDKDTKHLGHRIKNAYMDVLSIPDIPFDFPDDIEPFIKYVDAFGTNRYFEYPYYLLGEECLQLDRVVWFIRRYCYHMRQIVTTPAGETIDLFPLEIERVQRTYAMTKPHKFELFGGFLEKVIKDKKSDLRKQLVWKNFYYGSYKKQIIKDYTHRSSSANPTHYLHPEVFAELDKVVKFSEGFRKKFLGTHKTTR